MDDYESIAPEELGNLGESEIKLKSNGVCHVKDKLLEDIKIGAKIAIPPSETVMSPEGMGSSSPAVTNRHGLRKWRRIPRELVKTPGSNIDGRNSGDLSDSLVRSCLVNVNGNSNVLHGDFGLGNQPVLATRADSPNSVDQSNRSSSAASAPRTRPKISSSNGGNSAISVHPGDQKSNGQTGTSKKPRGFKTEKENSDSNMGKFVFVQGTNSLASKSKTSGLSAKFDEECDDDAQYADKLLNKEAESEDDTQQDAATKDSWEGSVDQNALVESITRFDSAVKELEREVQKWKDIGKDEPLIFDDSIHDTLELKDAMIMELESGITSVDTKTEIDHLLKEKIQAEVEIVAITTATNSLITGILNESKLNLQQKDMEAKKLETIDDVTKVQNKVLKKQETEEDVKKLQNRVCRLSSCLMIQLILLFVTFYLENSCQNGELVPT